MHFTQIYQMQYDIFGYCKTGGLIHPGGSYIDGKSCFYSEKPVELKLYNFKIYFNIDYLCLQKKKNRESFFFKLKLWENHRNGKNRIFCRFSNVDVRQIYSRNNLHPVKGKLFKGKKYRVNNFEEVCYLYFVGCIY